jgi:hypothetical protein
MEAESWQDVSSRRPAPSAEFPLAGHPGLADLDVGDRVRAHFVGIALEDRQIGLLARLERRVDRDGLIGVPAADRRST